MQKILIGTCNTQLWETLAAEISSLNYAPLWACTGLEVLETALAEAPALIFLSPNLPVFDGYEACTHLRQDPEIASETSIYLISDGEQNPHKLDRAGFSGTFPETHEQQTLQELLGNLAWPG